MKCCSVLLVLFSLLLLACPGKGGKGAPAADPAPAPPAPATDPAPAPDQDSSCDKVGAAFRKALAEATGKCEADADCAAWPILFDCGGITDKLSADKLRALREVWRAQKCGLGVQCAARIRELPICVEGECTGKPMK